MDDITNGVKYASVTRQSHRPRAVENSDRRNRWQENYSVYDANATRGPALGGGCRSFNGIGTGRNMDE